MLASAARVSAPMVCTGADMMALTGASRETRPTTTFSRRSTSVTMPSPSRVRTRIAERPSAFMSSAASWIVVSASHTWGAPRMTEVTGSVCTSRQRAQGARRVEQRVALGRRQPAHAVLAAEQLHAEVPGDAVERAVAARPHRERRRRAGEQAGVAEELAGRHHRDQGVPAQEVQGAVAQDVELPASAGRPRRSWSRPRPPACASPRQPGARADRRSASRTPRRGRGSRRSPRGSRPGCGGPRVMSAVPSWLPFPSPSGQSPVRRSQRQADPGASGDLIDLGAGPVEHDEGPFARGGDEAQLGPYLRCPFAHRLQTEVSSRQRTRHKAAPIIVDLEQHARRLHLQRHRGIRCA